LRGYRPPSKIVQTINRLVSWLAARGLTPADTVTLEVRGRRSGRLRPVVLTWVECAGDRYLVSLGGEAEWVRNVRAAGGQGTIHHRRRERVRLAEVPPEQRAPILKAYLSKRALSKTPAMSARQYFGMAPDPPVEALARVAAHYPVFRIVPGDNS
jgi:deazaflavin-dependent oxidoreductase (nitroreductase family)